MLPLAPCPHHITYRLLQVQQQNIWLRIWGSNPANHWLTVKSVHLARILRNKFPKMLWGLLPHCCLYRLRSLYVPDTFPDPAVFTLWLFLSTWFLSIEFESSSAHVIGTIHLIIQGRQGLGTPLGILVTTSTYIAAGDSRPRCFTLSSPSKKPITVWLSLADTLKTWSLVLLRHSDIPWARA